MNKHGAPPPNPFRTADTTTISEEALRRLNVEAAFGRGAPIQYRDRKWLGFEWETCSNPIWDWDRFEYCVVPPAAPHRTKAQILDQIHELLVELRDCDA